jgi:hypothetical protein
LLPFLKIYLGKFDQIGELIPDKKDDWNHYHTNHAHRSPRQRCWDG